MAVAEAVPQQAIKVEPLSAAVGLMIEGVGLGHLDPGAAAMLRDLWQLGGALLFRGQEGPAQAALHLAAALSRHPVAPRHPPDGIFGTDWAMPGAEDPNPPAILVFSLEAGEGTPLLEIAGMEAAADALRMEHPDFLADLAALSAAHCAGGPLHPLVHRHPLNDEAMLYPPPAGAAGNAGERRLQRHAVLGRFCYRHEWLAGDVLAVDPRAVRCRWAAAPGATVQGLLVAGAGPLLPAAAPLRPLD